MKTKQRIFKIEAILLTFFLCLSAALLPVQADNENYGEEAYGYLRTINDSFAYRINNNEITTDQSQLTAMKNWIEGKMAESGYTVKYYEGAIESHSFTSLSFTKTGTSAKRIVIGAHYDSVATNGCEDNGTGVAVALELAKRFADTDTNLTLEFCFWDGEEFRGMAGSYLYLEQVPDPENILLYMNLDCLGAGDNIYAYGGDYEESGMLVRSWGYNMAMTLSQELGIDLHEMPEGIDRYVTPTRTTASDQYYFNERGIPYVYFEANAWLNEAGVQGNSEKAYNYNSTLSCFADTNGQIIHTKYDDLDVLESLVPGRIKAHMAAFSQIISEMIRRMDETSPVSYQSYVRYTPPVAETESAATEADSEVRQESDTENSAETEETAVSEAVSVSEEAIPESMSGTAAGEVNKNAAGEFEEASRAKKTSGAMILGYGIIGLMTLVFILSVYKIIYWIKKKGV